MDEQVQIKNIDQVIQYSALFSQLLASYTELLQDEQTELSRLQQFIEQSLCSVNNEIKGIYTGIEQIKKQEESDCQQQALKDFQKKLQKYIQLSHVISQCQEELVYIKQELDQLASKSLNVSDTGKLLSSKIQILLSKIFDAF